jgi:hypothetical protein
MSVRTITSGVLALGLVLCAGCTGRLARLPMHGIASDAGAKAIEMYDTNKDGKISGPELDKCPALKASLPRIDLAGDGSVTADKITARINRWKEDKLSELPVHFTVLRNGSPLVGAEVKLVPEKFLGEDVKAGVGTTDRTGGVVIGVPTSDPGQRPHMAPGFYRVEITKAGDNIPARYNTQTTLGQEIAVDIKEFRMGGIKFDLKY